MRIQEFAAVFRTAAQGMAQYRDELCRLDSGIGDGDHGVTVSRGFLAAAAASEEREGFSALFAAIGDAMESATGGAIGPLYAAFFAAVAEAAPEGKDSTDVALLTALAAGAAGVARAGACQEGEKTVLDAMAPWARALRAAAEAGEDVPSAARKGAEAADAGARATGGMRATKGRARYRGERSIGPIDPGARSFALFAALLASALGGRSAEGGGSP
ncbi:MAG TPA: dihydroxyacetone kinase subunit DhaL [Spirochaetia bacterium]|nr:dihydroxyacetone kinase subunit DhaL [Spirochaetia bacterium]